MFKGTIGTYGYFPNHQYDTNYGLSESIGPGCVHLGVENPHKVGAIGKAGYGWEVKILDPDHNEVAKGEVGELIVKGPGVMLESLDLKLRLTTR